MAGARRHARNATRSGVRPTPEHLARHLRSTVADHLLAAAGRGDQGAFAAFYDRTVPIVYGLLCRGLGEDAAGATERVYVRLWRAAPRFRPAAGPCAYALVLAATGRELAARTP